MDLMRDLVDLERKRYIKKYEKRSKSTLYYAQNLQDMLNSNLKDLTKKVRVINILVDTPLKYNFSNSKNVEFECKIGPFLPFMKPFTYNYPTMEIEAFDSIYNFEAKVNFDAPKMSRFLEEIDDFHNLYSNMSLYHYFPELNRPELIDIYDDENLRLKKNDSKIEDDLFSFLPTFSY